MATRHLWLPHRRDSITSLMNGFTLSLAFIMDNALFSTFISFRIESSAYSECRPLPQAKHSPTSASFQCHKVHSIDEGTDSRIGEYLHTALGFLPWFHSIIEGSAHDICPPLPSVTCIYQFSTQQIPEIHSIDEESIHVSVSRTVVLRAHQIDKFMGSARRAFAVKKP